MTGAFQPDVVLVTGGAGFIGSQVAHAIPADTELIVLDDLSAGDRSAIPDRARFIQGDIRDTEVLDRLVPGVDVIFHQAALVSVEASVADPVSSHVINATSTLNVLEAARRHEARVVLASSAAIYGDPEYTPIDETHPPSPRSPYGLEKFAADHYAQLYHDLYGLETVSLRYFNVYGPTASNNHYSGVIDIFLGQALAGDDVTVHGDGSQTRDFVYIDDIVDANLAAATTDHVGAAYNIGTGDAISIRELAERVVSLTDMGAGIVHVNGRDGDVARSEADISKARDRLGFTPQWDLDSGLREAIRRRPPPIHTIT